MTQRPGPGDTGRYDVVIVGGGPAGLNAALMLGCARRSLAARDITVVHGEASGVEVTDDRLTEVA